MFYLVAILILGIYICAVIYFSTPHKDEGLTELRRIREESLTDLRRIREESKRVKCGSGYSDEHIARELAYADLKEIEKAVGLWEPVIEKEIIPAQYHTQIVLDTIECSTFGGESWDIPTATEYRTEEVLFPEKIIEKIIDWKPIEGFIP